MNEDPFFKAPVSTAECKSAFGVNPNKACEAKPKYVTPQTAETSPYDYLTTVVIAQCTQSGPVPPAKRCGADRDTGRGGVWSEEMRRPLLLRRAALSAVPDRQRMGALDRK